MARRFARIFRLVGREPTVSDDVSAEITTHLAQVTEHLVAQGWKPDAARDEALRRFGDVDQFRRELGRIDRQAGRRRAFGERFDTVRQDLALAVRGLARSPAYAAVVVGTLGLALGANATMFGVVDRLLLRPPPGFVAPELVSRVEAARWSNGQIGEAWDAVSYPSFEGLASRTAEFSHVAAETSRRLSFGVGADARPVRSVMATGQYFALAGGVAPALGRFFGEADDQGQSGNAVAVLSHAFWRDGLGADPGVIGRSYLLNGQPFEVIGVAPPRFTGSDLRPVDLWIPLSTTGLLDGEDPDGDHSWRTARGFQWLNVLVRRRPGISLEQAATGATIGYRAGNEGYDPFEARAEVRFRTLIEYSEDGSAERIAGWLYGVTLVVLLIACANIANLVLARGIVRRTETAVRQALGIPRGRLIRQALVETAVVMAAGLGVGLLLAGWGGALVRRVLLADTAFSDDPVDLRVLAATAGAAAIAGGLASLWPLLRNARVDPAAELHGAGRTTRRGGRARAGLLLAQTTLATALVVMAGLFLRSIDRIRGLDLGIRPAGVTLASVNLSSVVATPAEALRFYERVQGRIRRIPGIEAAGLTQAAPFLGNMGGRIIIPGRDSIPRQPGGGPYYFQIGDGTMEAYGVRLLSGRRFTEADREGSAPVVVVSERMANTLWPGQSAIGQCFKVGSDSMPCRQIVGIVSDLHRQGLDEEPFFLYFSVLTQAAEPAAPDYIVIRTAEGTRLPTEAIRAAFTAERPDLPYIQLRDYRDILDGYSRPWRLGASLLSVFGGLSLVIAAIGLAGVIGFGISRRTRELGLRSALGAPPARLLRTVLAGGMMTAAAGIGLGVALALVAAPRLQAMLFRTEARDPVVLAAAAALVLVVSAIAAWVPGRRAIRIDPVRALRSD